MGKGTGKEFYGKSTDLYFSHETLRSPGKYGIYSQYFPHCKALADILGYKELILWSKEVCCFHSLINCGPCQSPFTRLFELNDLETSYSSTPLSTVLLSAVSVPETNNS